MGRSEVESVFFGQAMTGDEGRNLQATEGRKVQGYFSSRVLDFRHQGPNFQSCRALGAHGSQWRAQARGTF